MSFEILIGVKEYRILLKKCPLSQKAGELSITFSLVGDFLKAAENDSLSDTIDYFVLCEKLQKELESHSCTDGNLKEIVRSILLSSPKVKNAHLEILTLCH